jgi:hypothetical protein
VTGDGNDDVRSLIVTFQNVVEEQLAAASDDAQRRRGKSGAANTNGEIAICGGAEIFDVEEHADDVGGEWEPGFDAGLVGHRGREIDHCLRGRLAGFDGRGNLREQYDRAAAEQCGRADLREQVAGLPSGTAF